MNTDSGFMARRRGRAPAGLPVRAGTFPLVPSVVQRPSPAPPACHLWAPLSEPGPLPRDAPPSSPFPLALGEAGRWCDPDLGWQRTWLGQWLSPCSLVCHGAQRTRSFLTWQHSLGHLQAVSCHTGWGKIKQGHGLPREQRTGWRPGRCATHQPCALGSLSNLSRLQSLHV